MSTTKEITILPDSPLSATKVNMDLWKSRTGKIFLDEAAARVDGATVSICRVCNGYCKKHWTICDDCNDKKANERYEKLELVEWNGETPLVGFMNDNYMLNLDDVWEYCNENECQPSSLRLVVCTPIAYPKLSYDYFEDVLPEDADMDEALVSKIDEFNAFLETLSTPSWGAGNKRVTLPDFDDLDYLPQ